MSTVPKRFLTPQEYLAIERQAEIKSEYYNGEMFAMAGGTAAHDLIVGNLNGILWRDLAGGPCRAHTSDMRIKITATGMFTYPDVSVVCGQPIYDGDQRGLGI